MAAFTIQDIAWGVGGTPTDPTGGVYSLLASRNDLLERGIYQWIYDAILEISRDFRFQDLEKTGPIVGLQPNIVSYNSNIFVLPEDQGRMVNLEPSFVRFFNPYTPIPGL